MIDQFYAVVNDEDQYMYRSGCEWRGNPYPRATGCAGTEAKCRINVLEKVLDDQIRQADQINNSIFRWEHSTSSNKELMIKSFQTHMAEVRARKFRLVKVTVDIT